jgi:hypothetical protein
MGRRCRTAVTGPTRMNTDPDPTAPRRSPMPDGAVPEAAAAGSPLPFDQAPVQPATGPDGLPPRAADDHPQANPAHLLGSASVTPRERALARLAASRGELAAVLIPPPPPRLTGRHAAPGPMSRRIGAWLRYWRWRLNDSPLAGVASDAARDWWYAHPWRPTAELVAEQGRSARPGWRPMWPVFRTPPGAGHGCRCGVCRCSRSSRPPSPCGPPARRPMRATPRTVPSARPMTLDTTPSALRKPLHTPSRRIKAHSTNRARPCRPRRQRRLQRPGRTRPTTGSRQDPGPDGPLWTTAGWIPKPLLSLPRSLLRCPLPTRLAAPLPPPPALPMPSQRRPLRRHPTTARRHSPAAPDPTAPRSSAMPPALHPASAPPHASRTTGSAPRLDSADADPRDAWLDDVRRWYFGGEPPEAQDPTTVPASTGSSGALPAVCRCPVGCAHR